MGPATSGWTWTLTRGNESAIRLGVKEVASTGPRRET